MPEKPVTWAELFFDLVFVFAVTEVSSLLREDVSWAGLGRALVVFVPIYWAWVGTTIHANTTNVDTSFERIGIFATGLCSLFMALAVPGAYGSRAVLFAAAFLLLRVVSLFFSGPQQSFAFGPMSIAVFITGPARLISAFFPYPILITVWAIAAVLDLATPILTRRRLLSMRFHPGHLPERFGTFIIIALGESIVAIGAPAATSAHLTVDVLVAVAIAFVLAAALWWVYYVFAASAIRHAMLTASVRTDLVREVLSYGHLAFLTGIIAAAVGMAAVVAHPTHRLEIGVVGLLFGGCALYLATFGYTRWRMFHRISIYRLAGAAVAVFLIPLAVYVPAVAALGALTAVVVGVNVTEHLVVRRRGSM
ncbi:low temperature requirement protein A [Fodinicola feengrottensis]|uniref:Low temperature requirement protein A n=1 Tax=Fodinicola feengrottensis TaxID=435914 RepID=A0ABN2G431_9ACTN|nr:low temperature requirement protein A [Fodinicola feengrottensis]